MKTPGNRIYINLSQGSTFFLVGLGLLVYAFWYSLFSLLPLALADTPISYITVVPVVSLAVAYIKSRYSSIPEVRRDPFVDNSLSALLVLVALFSILLMPAAMSWRYWVYRMDLLLIPVFLLAVLILFRGLHFVALYW